ncbi:MAG TPA: hypothetical protein VFU69_05880, partial [Ktedonobacterales bacterium]|nr:hypothetical protein [Ktedonobacterales bacterium]
MSFDDALDEQEYQTAMRLHPRRISEEQMRRFEGYMAEIFSAFGMELDSPATEKTPQRFIRAMYD